ncbi:amino acid/polyamine transporter I [Tanacetum coccineum]
MVPENATRRRETLYRVSLVAGGVKQEDEEEEKEEEEEEGGPYHRLHYDAGASNEIIPTGHDDSKLNELGYKQELNRSLSLVSNFSVTFSIISVITGLFTLLVGLSMSEICSAYPTAAGLYFWSAKLCGNEWGPFGSWLTGCIASMSSRGLRLLIGCNNIPNNA